MTSPDTVVRTSRSARSTTVQGSDRGTHGREAVKALAQRELAQRRFELRPATRDVVDGRDATHRAERVLARRPVGAAADHHPQLTFEVRSRLLARDHDRLLRADERRRPLGEDHGHRGHIQVGLLGVGTVVEPDGEDLPGRDGVQQGHVGDGVALPVGRGDAPPAVLVGGKAEGAGSPSVDDGVLLQRADTLLALRCW